MTVSLVIREGSFLSGANDASLYLIYRKNKFTAYNDSDSEPVLGIKPWFFVLRQLANTC